MSFPVRWKYRAAVKHQLSIGISPPKVRINHSKCSKYGVAGDGFIQGWMEQPLNPFGLLRSHIEFSSVWPYEVTYKGVTSPK